MYIFPRVGRNPQKLTQLSSRSHPRHLVGKRTAQKDTIIDITSNSQVNSNFPYRWSLASLFPENTTHGEHSGDFLFNSLDHLSLSNWSLILKRFALREYPLKRANCCVQYSFPSLIVIETNQGNDFVSSATSVWNSHS